MPVYLSRILSSSISLPQTFYVLDYEYLAYEYQGWLILEVQITNIKVDKCEPMRDIYN